MFRETFERLLEEFTIPRWLARSEAKDERVALRVLDGALAEKDEEARALMRRLETERKHAFRALEKDMLGVADLFERMLGDDPEYAKLKALPNEQVNAARGRPGRVPGEVRGVARATSRRARAQRGAPPGRTTRARDPRGG